MRQCIRSGCEADRPQASASVPIRAAEPSPLLMRMQRLQGMLHRCMSGERAAAASTSPCPRIPHNPLPPGPRSLQGPSRLELSALRGHCPNWAEMWTSTGCVRAKPAHRDRARVPRIAIQNKTFCAPTNRRRPITGLKVRDVWPTRLDLILPCSCAVATCLWGLARDSPTQIP